MTAPQKPWESQHYKSNPIINQGDVPQSSRLVHQHVNVLNSNAPPLSTQPAGRMRPLMLPSLPPRPPHLTTSSLRPMGMAPTMYGGYAGGYTGGYNSGYGGGYGNYPGSMYMPGGYNYGSYGNFGNGFQNRFLQVAEEGSRNAFQSIASIVHAFTSVSMMLESTYHAMYSSFQAILGVVDNFSRLRLVFTQLLSAITILRTIRNFYWKLLYWLGILKNKPQAENVWRTAGLPVDPNNQVVKYSSWPLITFFGLLFGGPYLISKFFSAKPKDWDNERGTTVRAAYPHQAASEAELSFNAQDVLNLAPPELQDNNTGWMLARNCQGRVGYVPVTRLNVIPGAAVNNIPNNQDVNTST